MTSHAFESSFKAFPGFLNFQSIFGGVCLEKYVQQCQHARTLPVLPIILPHFHRQMRNGLGARLKPSFIGHQSAFLCKASATRGFKTNSKAGKLSKSAMARCASTFCLFLWAFLDEMLIFCPHKLFFTSFSCQTSPKLFTITICSAKLLKIVTCSHESSPRDIKARFPSDVSCWNNAQRLCLLNKLYPYAALLLGNERNCIWNKNGKTQQKQFFFVSERNWDDKHFLYYPEWFSTVFWLIYRAVEKFLHKIRLKFRRSCSRGCHKWLGKVGSEQSLSLACSNGECCIRKSFLFEDLEDELSKLTYKCNWGMWLGVNLATPLAHLKKEKGFKN